MINKLSEKIHKNNVSKGFYEEEKNIGEMLALIHSEVSEALEADRKGRYFSEHNIGADKINREQDDEIFLGAFEHYVKDSFEDELADIMIRVMDLAKHKNVDLEQHLIAKMRYNSKREYKHGKKY